MAKHIGIVACSAEGAALCYRTICGEAPDRMGEHMHPEVTMHTHPLHEYMNHIQAGEWRAVADLMLSSAQKLAKGGADFCICPDNTIHRVFQWISEESPLPWLHIAEIVAAEAARRGFKRLGITGTKYLMAGPVYHDALGKHGIGCENPDASDRKMIDDIIFQELTHGVLKEESRLYFNEVFQTFKERGCDAAVLGCTEIPLLVDPNDCPLPTLDSTRLLARAAVAEALTG
jgi:aspartate racemase